MSSRVVGRVAPGTQNAGNVALFAADIVSAASCIVAIQCAFDASAYTGGGIGVYLTLQGGAIRIPLADPVDGVALQSNKMYVLTFRADPRDAWNLQLSGQCSVSQLLAHEDVGEI